MCAYINECWFLYTHNYKYALFFALNIHRIVFCNLFPLQAWSHPEETSCSYGLQRVHVGGRQIGSKDDIVYVQEKEYQVVADLFWTLEVVVVNSYTVYNSHTSSTRKLAHDEF